MPAVTDTTDANSSDNRLQPDQDAASPAALSEHAIAETTSKAMPMVTVLPEGEASAEEVRQYIYGNLVTNHNTTEEYAQQVASQWRLGRGWSLHSMSKSRFVQLFGDDIGPYLFTDVNAEINHKRARQTAKWKKKHGEDYIGECSSLLPWTCTNSDVVLTTISVGLAGIVLLLIRRFHLPALIVALMQMAFVGSMPHDDTRRGVILLIGALLFVTVYSVM